MSHVNGKRKAREYDAKLVRVARALESVIRDGATFASGTSEQFPMPAITFTRGGDNNDANDEHELMLSLRADDAQKIKTRGMVAQQHDKENVAWEADGGLVETRNPQWQAFLNLQLAEIRPTIGIAQTADVEIKLRKLVLVEAGGTLISPREDGGRRARAGVFGSLLVVLPGAFEGGDVLVEGQSSSKQHPMDDATKRAGIPSSITWPPSARKTTYDLSFAVLYDNCVCSAEPVRCGAALCLMYDLVTTTPVEVPLFVGLPIVQQEVESSLDDYFDTIPAVAKRLKISPDLWSTINRYTVERHFAYIIDAPSFDELSGDERKIASSLKAFCAQSEGQYVLYIATALCSRNRAQSMNEDSPFGDGRVSEMSVTLRAPWIKSDESDKSTWVPGSSWVSREPERPKYPPVFLRHVHEVAPLGRVEEFPLETPRNYMDDTNYDIIGKLYGDCGNAGSFLTHALVVQPASVEQSQGAKLPNAAILARLGMLLDRSRDEALQYAWRIVYHGSLLILTGLNVDAFYQFVRVVVKLNDRELFIRLLRAVELTREVYALGGATTHFGWDACEDAIIKRILSTSTLDARVNLLVSVVGSRLDTERVDRLLDALLSVYPWTDIMVETLDNARKYDNLPSSGAFSRLLHLASSVHRMRQLMLVTADPELMVRVIAGAVVDSVRKNPSSELLRCGVLSLWERYQPMIARLRNDLYDNVCIMNHCHKCDELLAFVRSDEPHTTVSYTDETERAHIEDIMTRVAREPALVKIEPAGDSKLGLTKAPKPEFGCLLDHAEHYEKELMKLISGRD